MTALRVVMVTAPADRATDLARTLVSEGLAACVNVLPGATSIYRWDGAVCEDPESLLVVKTTAEGMGALTARILTIHPYRVPEVLALPVDSTTGNPAYLQWVASSVGGGKAE